MKKRNGAILLHTSLIIHTSHLRFVVILMAILIFIGAGLRAICILVSMDANTFTAFAHTGSFFNGIAGALVMSAPSALSVAWFPPNERMLATCISQSAAFLGNGLSFVIGPAFVKMPLDIINGGSVDETDENRLIDELKDEISKYMFYIAHGVN